MWWRECARRPRSARCATSCPRSTREFEGIAERLESHYRDVQDLEFTIERGKLFMLQTRSGKRTARGGGEDRGRHGERGDLSRQEAVQRVDPNQIVQLLLPRFDEAAKARPATFLARGLNASPGAATGQAVLDPGSGGGGQGRRRPGDPGADRDQPGRCARHAGGAWRAHRPGGATSHAAVVARSMGLPCVAGAETLKIDYARREMKAGKATVREGDMISIDGTTGEIFAGELPTIEARFEDEHDLATLLSWADEIRRLQVGPTRTTRAMPSVPVPSGPQGIGLCRTEHMFFEEERLPTVQRMILNATRATEAKHRRDAGDKLSAEDSEAITTFDSALAELEVLQTDDFGGLFRAMDGLPVVHPADRPAAARVPAGARRAAGEGDPPPYACCRHHRVQTDAVADQASPAWRRAWPRSSAGRTRRGR